MSTKNLGNKTALMIVDVQAGVMRHAWEANRVISNICMAVEKARMAGVPVIWVQHSDEELVMNSDDWQWVPELVPVDGEIRIYKLYNSAFEQTTLEDTLDRLRISHILLAGASTNWCIRATAYGALDRGYDLTLIEDAHTTGTMEFEDGTNIEAAHIIRELNTAMKWLSYPDRKNRSLPVDQIQLTA